MSKKKTRIPVAEWLALKLVADEFGGVGAGMLFDDVTDPREEPDSLAAPRCIMGIALEAGVLPWDTRFYLGGREPTYHGFTLWHFDDVLGINNDTRIPFEEAMERFGFKPVGA